MTAAEVMKTPSYSLQSVNHFSGKWQTEYQTNDYMQARYDRAQLRKVKGRKNVRIIRTLDGELVD